MRNEGKQRRLLWVLGPLVIAGLAAILLLFVGAPKSAETLNENGTDNAGALLWRVYDMPPEQTRQVAGSVGATMLGWHVIGSSPSGSTIVMEAPARFGTARDEVTATVVPTGKNAAVRIVSRARYLGQDFGSNRRHVLELQAAMDRQLPPAQQKP